MKFTLPCALLIVALRVAAAGAQEVASIADLSLEALGTVRVSGVSKVEESLVSAPASVTVVAAAQFERFGWRTVGEVIDAAPGMLLTSSFFVQSAPAIRGDIRATSGVHVLILLNGRPLRGSLDALGSQDLLAQIPLAALDRVELIRGPGSVLYGTNAFAGVINLVTRDGDGSSVTADGQVGTLNSYAALAQGATRSGTVHLSLTGQLLRSADLDRTVADQTGQARAVSLPAKGGAVIGGLRVGGFSIDGLYTRWESPSLASFLPGLPAIDFSTDELFLGGALQGNLSPRLNGRVDLDYTRTRATAGGIVDTRPDADDVLLEGTLFFKASSRWHMLAGATANLLTGQAVYFGMPALKYHQWIGSGYLQTEFSPGSNWRFVLGGQAITTPDIPIQVVPRAAAVYGGSRGFGIKLLYGEAFRSPSPTETQIDAPGLITGNPDLRSERMHTGELVFSYQGERGDFALNLFSSHEKDLITSATLPGGGVSYVNQGDFDARGAELEGTFRPSRAWSFLGSVSYQDNKLNDSLSDVGRSPQWLVRAGASWSPGANLTVSLFDNWLGAAPPISRQFPGAPVVNPPNEAYHLISARITVGLSRLFGLPASTRLAARLGVDNLLDQETWYPDATFGGVNSLPWRPGRMVFAGLTLNWAGK